MNEHRTPEEQQALDAQYMALALEEARAAGAAGEVPIGAVVVYEPIDRGTRRPLAEPRVIARGRNRREADRDPAGHAEFLAMKEAARVLDAWRLTDCTVYVTLEPCIMCAGLMHQARIARCVYGAPDQKAGAVGTLYDHSRRWAPEPPVRSDRWRAGRKSAWPCCATSSAPGARSRCQILDEVWPVFLAYESTHLSLRRKCI